MARKQADQAAYRKLLGDIKGGHFASVYLLYGEELYLQDYVVSLIDKALIDDRSRAMDMQKLDVDQKPSRIDFNQLEDALRTPSFFSKRRLIILKNTGLFTSEGQSLQDRTLRLIEIAGRSSFVSLIFQEEKIDKRYKKLVQGIEAAGILVEISVQGEEALRPWIAAFLQRDQIRITQEATESLILRSEGKMRPLMDQLKKLRLFCLGSKSQEVDLQTVEGLAGPDLQGDIFKLTDALSTNRPDDARHLYQVLLDQGQPYQRILVMIARHFRQLLIAKELGRADAIQSRLGVMGFVARKLSQQTSYYSIQQLLSYYEACVESDWAIKSGLMDEAMAVDLLLSQLSGVTV